MARSLENLREDLRFHLWPREGYLPIYGGTGLVAGWLAHGLERWWSCAPYQHALLPNSRGVKLIPTKEIKMFTFPHRFGSGFVARTGIRFLAFGQFKHIRDVKREMGTNTRPEWVDIGVCGAAAGLVETVVANRIANPLSGFPPVVQLVRHPAKLLLCFSTFGFLTGKFAARKPREIGIEAYGKESWKRAIFAMLAGGMGTAVTAAAEGLRGKPLWMNAVPRGATVIGAVIFFQVESCTICLEIFRRKGLPGRERIQLNGR